MLRIIKGPQGSGKTTTAQHLFKGRKTMWVDMGMLKDIVFRPLKVNLTDYDSVVIEELQLENVEHRSILESILSRGGVQWWKPYSTRGGKIHLRNVIITAFSLPEDIIETYNDVEVIDVQLNNPREW